MRRMPGVLIFLVATFLLAAPGLARAEWFIEPYLGAAFTSEDDVEVNASAPGVVLNFDFKDVDFKDSLLAGLRGGYWFPSAPNLGVALDVFYFQPDVKRQTTIVTASGAFALDDTLVVAAGTGPVTLDSLDVKVVAVSADFMVRLKLSESSQFPNGQFQPYAFVGPAVFFIVVEDEDDTNLGVKAGAGIQWMLTPAIGLFAEYRFTHVNVDVRASEGSVSASFETDLDSHSVLGGISFRF